MLIKIEIDWPVFKPLIKFKIILIKLMVYKNIYIFLTNFLNAIFFYKNQTNRTIFA